VTTISSKSGNFFWVQHYRKIESRRVPDSSPCAFYRAHGEAILRRVFFLAHGEVMVRRVLFSGTRRSQASLCAFYLTHSEVIVCRVFFLAHGKAIIFFSVYDGRYEGAAALGFAVCHEKAHGDGKADNKKSSSALQIFFPNPQATCCNPC